MKKTYLFCLIILNVNFLLAQITISDYNNKQEEKIYPKPIPFDTTSNWIEFNNLYENKQYIGLKVYFPITANNEIIENQYCIITDVLYGDKLEKFWSDFERKCDSCPLLLDNRDYSNVRNRDNTKLIFQVKDEKTNAFFYFTYYELKENILVQYFENQQSKYKNKVLIYDDIKTIQSLCKTCYHYLNCNYLLNDIKKTITSENVYKEMQTVPKEVILKRGSKWTCIDVTLIKDTDIYTDNYFSDKYYSPRSSNYKKSDHFKYRMFYILKNNLDETIAFESLNPLVGEDKESESFFDSQCHFGHSIIPSSSNKLVEQKNNPFILESYYIERERQKKITTQALLAKQKEEENKRKLKEKNDLIAKRNDLITKYGTKYGNLIFENKIIIGMDSEMCKLSWGTPYSNNKQITAEKTIEIWHYSLGTDLYFYNDKLVQIEQ